MRYKQRSGNRSMDCSRRNLIVDIWRVRHIVRAHCATSAASAKLIGHLRTSQILLLSRETDEDVAINPFSAPAKMHVSPISFDGLDPHDVLVAFALDKQ